MTTTEELEKPMKWGLSTLIKEPFTTPQSPIALLKKLNAPQWFTFLAAFIGWTLDAMAYFSVNLAVTEIALDFEVPNSRVAEAITITLAVRSVGALLFGLAADKWGRRWPLMVDIVMFAGLELASGFAPDFNSFFIIRALFGIAMGGEWGLGNAIAMEAVPPECRGLFSGILQQGYAMGNLLATALYFLIVPRLGWRALMWICSFPAFLAIGIRFFVPESETFEEIARRRQAAQGANDFKAFARALWVGVKKHYLLAFYCVILMACFNFFSHGSQDLYPTFLKTQLGYSVGDATTNNFIGSAGAIVGGTLLGYYGQYIGRRRCVILCCIGAGVCVYPWSMIANIAGLRVSVFFIQFFIQGAWGNVPAYLSELSPPTMRGLFPGLCYQLGNLISSASAQVEAQVGEQYPTTNAAGASIPNYALTQAILIGGVSAILLLVISFGPEQKDALVNIKDFQNAENFEIVHIEVGEKQKM
ncbi:hypothetical protein SmJEL517_g01616 [Synchytrium microbalum]|uniref:Major facilitator superfamily (MFS) profile domain-containing protein n=1 Tax=Synchytrium microbalum TaxID=1806994 RepID=A0A507C9W5_9FUNG|nr:uncharacterized protein SmJEL517_g01616 [Synchytrium microbalum]TPX36138.1 hypothetical protein SmJEL517_g01616 [Synchytrium microbalum]